MRAIKTLLASLGLVLLTSTTGLAMMLQDPTIKVDVSTTEGSSTWYTSPVWLAIGGLAAHTQLAKPMSSGWESGSWMLDFVGSWEWTIPGGSNRSRLAIHPAAANSAVQTTSSCKTSGSLARAFSHCTYS